VRRYGAAVGYRTGRGLQSVAFACRDEDYSSTPNRALFPFTFTLMIQITMPQPQTPFHHPPPVISNTPMKRLITSLILLNISLCQAADLFHILYPFEKGANDGDNQESIAPLIRDNPLYAATRNGGHNETGLLFRLNSDEKHFRVFLRFADSASLPGATNGTEPYDTLTVHQNAPYGLTRSGGNDGDLLFRYDLDSP